ncbi:histidine phosphatase family protein [Aquirufa ecclesiirivi]|uniref:histidine phosphatase family protein n=1 Tax=Aquirufa ecclesiirivi TaxID=2715124 RepID=UPI0023D8605D|nr:histidine phosphatase family protein [Aquirufa ecclesiirivi]MDF0693517.1 histidine phosphatase family protein [Aquirufa ecclesiirivi]
MHPIKDIYLIRHGETDYNRRGVVQGSGIDAHLNELGRQQAQAFFDHYEDLYLDKIYTSALIRTHQSVDGFIKKGIAWEQHSGLNEISWGNKEGKSPNTDDDLYYKNLTRTWREGNIDVPSEEGESPVQVLERQKPVVDLILSRPQEQAILIAMHGRAMRVLLTHLFEQPLHKMDDFAHSNLCLYHLQYSYPDRVFKLVKGPLTEHLKHLPDSM